MYGYGDESGVRFEKRKNGYWKIVCNKDTHIGKYFIINKENGEGFIAQVENNLKEAIKKLDDFITIKNFCTSYFYINESMNSIFTEENINDPDLVKYWDNTEFSHNSLFKNLTFFNSRVDYWDISEAKYNNISKMFQNCINFNQPLNNWNTSNITNMDSLFDGAISFNQPLDNWDTSKVIYMHYMFRDASSFNQPLNNWNISNVKMIYGMFDGASSFDQPLNNWTFNEELGNFESMFNGAINFNQDITNWDMSKAYSLSNMFSFADNFNQNISSWNVENVATINNMFNEAKNFEQDLSSWRLRTDYCYSNMTPPNVGIGHKITGLPTWNCPDI